ncbi:MAG: DUF3108 domain-containing protein [Kiritimatiellae bacterium]|nr:DUF3108 domain-containing protein [Kiritimatiellia bacterium]MDD5520521.1 DUF3108 domain-containing protein [Kiritimatiellia bacterium]
MNIKYILKCYSGILALVISPVISSVYAQEKTDAVTNDTARFGFPVGEELIYRIYWGYIPVGLTTVKTEWIEEDGKKLIAIRYRTHTNRIFDTIYPVDDRAESIINPDKFLPVRFYLCLTRRRSKTEKSVIFDHSRLKAAMVTTSTGQTNEIDIVSDTRDIITLLYSHRLKGVSTNQEWNCRPMIDTGLLNMKLKTYDYEDIKLSHLGKVSGLKLEPIAKLDSLLVEDGKVMSWVAKERCLATKMTIKAPLANVSIELHEVLGPGNDLWSEAMQKAFPDKEKTEKEPDQK